MRRLAFVATPQDAGAYASGLRTQGGTTFCIAMSPSARASLLQQGVPADSTLSYFSLASHMQLSRSSQALCAWLDVQMRWVGEGISVTEAYRDALSFWMRMAINHVLWTIEVAANACEQHRPVALVASLTKVAGTPRPQPIPEETLYWLPEEQCLGALIQRLAANRQLPFELAPRCASPLRRVLIVPTRVLRSTWSVVACLFHYARQKLYRSRIVIRARSAGHPCLLHTSATRPVQQLVNQLTQTTTFVHYFLPESTIPTHGALASINLLMPREVAEQIAQQRRMLTALEASIRSETERFTYRGIAFADIIADKFRDDLATYLLGLRVWTHELRQFLRALRPSAVLSIGNRSDDALTAALCREVGIAGILISHGSFVRSSHEIEQNEWEALGKQLMCPLYPFLAAQSPLAEGYLQARPSPAQTVKTGPLIWGAAVDRVRSLSTYQALLDGRVAWDTVRIVVHAGTPKQSRGLRFLIYETPDEYVQALCELAKAIEGIPNTILIIKFRPSPEISAAALQALVPFSNKVLLSIDEPFADVLGLAHLLVSYSSTTIEEALQNRIPVLLYGGLGRYQHVPSQEVRPDQRFRLSASYHVTESGHLAFAVEKILTEHGNQGQAKSLFDPYIYPPEARTSLRDWLNGMQEGVGATYA